MGKKMLHSVPTVARDAAGEWSSHGWKMSIPAGRGTVERSEDCGDTWVPVFVVEHSRSQVVDFEARLGGKPLYRWVDA